MTDRPIIFSGAMVRALLDGRKTQTRRLLKDVPTPPADDNVVHDNPKHKHAYFDAYCGAKKTEANPRGMTENWCWWTRDDRCGHGCKVRFVPGDRLWVKERHYVWDAGYQDGSGQRISYEATEPDAPCTFTSSRHAPKFASRLTLIVEGVKVERLQGISEADAIAEGTQEPSLRKLGGELAQAAMSERQVYRRLWNHLHGAGSWDANPWVVAVTFRVEHGNIDRLVA